MIADIRPSYCSWESFSRARTLLIAARSAAAGQSRSYCGRHVAVTYVRRSCWAGWSAAVVITSVIQAVLLAALCVFANQLKAARTERAKDGRRRRATGRRRTEGCCTD